MNSHQTLNDLREQSRTLAGVAVYQGAGGSILAGGQPEYAQGMKVDRYFFPLVGVAPALGRGFTFEDEQEKSSRNDHSQLRILAKALRWRSGDSGKRHTPG